MKQHDPMIRIELLAATLGVSREYISREMVAGRIPRHDATSGKIRGWRLSTIAAWNPRLARNIEGLLNTPYLPAA